MSAVAASIAARAAAAARAASSNSTGATSNSTKAAATQSGAAGAAAAAAKPNDFAIVLSIDVILLSLIALLFLLRLPRFLARLWRFSEWTSGLILQNRPYHKRTAGRRVQFSMTGNPSNVDLSSDESHTTYQEKAFAQRISAPSAPAEAAYPPHVSSCISIFRPMLKLMHARLVSGVSFSHAVVMTAWVGAIVYPAFYRTNAFTDPTRFGWITASQLPFVYAFGTKNNILGMFLGIGYEKLNFMHRHSARIVLVAVNVHGLGFIYKWCLADDFMESIAEPKCYWGLIGLICIDGLFLFSTEFFRKKAYNLFLATHICALTVLVIAMLNHYRGTIPWAYACAAFYLFDILQRVLKTRVSTATIRTIPELGITRVEIPNINSGWRAGQHVRLRVISSGMGLIGWSEIHPFTIASVANSPEGLVLFCKKAGDWTNKLYDMANVSSSEDNGRKVSVMVQGPYGGLGNCMISSFSGVVFVCGGSGITLATSAMQELIQQDMDSQSRVKSIELIWTIQDASALVPLLPLFTSMIEQSVFTPIRVSVFYTRAPSWEIPILGRLFSAPPRFTLSPGRPKIQKAYRRYDQSHCVCGPVSLADSVFKDTSKIDPFRRDQIGGVEVHAETFGW
ncbi:hypothetical protein BT96DRAFT_974233 [Gymnopus androsaceus JB14]|uniref:ferric-chelate reductase (NADPH) n=1 Tax=Gymnopus androsaceus JB14 TaxID=1447944 RepID=A0A6A4HVY2_9AGAR|nr:hypothetical protein BT96DRAFT_974233 [Gymnopus androsaceus JB14]